MSSNVLRFWIRLGQMICNETLTTMKLKKQLSLQSFPSLSLTYLKKSDVGGAATFTGSKYCIYPSITGYSSYLYPSFPSSTTSCLNSSYIFLLKWSRRKNDQKRNSVFISCDWPIPSRFRSVIGQKERDSGQGFFLFVFLNKTNKQIFFPLTFRITLMLMNAAE